MAKDVRHEREGTISIDRPASDADDAERSRLETLRRFAVLDTPPEAIFDRITRLAATLFDTPMAVLSLVDERRQWFKSAVGIELRETPREIAFCNAAIESDDVMVVADARDDIRFRKNPLVVGEPDIRFYAGAPLKAFDGSRLGTLCVMDRRPRTFDAAQSELLAQLSALAMEHLEIRLGLLAATAAQSQLRAVIDASPSPIASIARGGEVTAWNGAAVRVFGWTESEILGRVLPFVPPELSSEGEALRSRIIDGVEPVHDLPAVRMRKDGTRIDVSISGAPILDLAGSPSGAVYVIDDVTSARRAQQIERHRYEILELAANDAPLEQILERIMSSVEYSIQGASGTIMLLCDDRLDHAASSAGMPPDFMSVIAGKIGHATSPCGTAAYTGEAVVVADLASDPRWRGYRELAAQHGLAACWSAPIVNGGGRVLGTLAFYFHDIRVPQADELHYVHEAAHVASIAIEGHNARVKLEEMALHDSLTGLPNRTLFEDRLDFAIAAAKRSGKRVALGLIDLDRFKQVNDNFGHAVGDRLLREVANRFQRSLRPQDTIARIGGDEFLLLVTEVDDRATAHDVAGRLLGSLEQGFAPGGHDVSVRASIGLSLYPDDSLEPTHLIRLADRAMYDAKACGDSTWVYDETKRRVPVASLPFERALRGAIDNGEFELAYQPEISIASGELVACETLLRWKHPELGTLMPDQFIASAEGSGSIDSIGAWVLREACRFARRWADAGGPGVVAVNVSPQQFEDRQFVRTVLDALYDARIEPRQLRLEITESRIMRSPDAAAATLQQLRDVGVSTIIDAFGTGYSSLNYLKRFPIDGLKIDGVFLRDISADARSRNDGAIALAILAVGRALQLNVLAEGVETVAQLEFLREHGCHGAQGFLFSRALDSDAMVRWRPG